MKESREYRGAATSTRNTISTQVSDQQRILLFKNSQN